MHYKAYLYILCVLLSAFAFSGVNFDNFISKNKVWEARILIMILSCISGYLLTEFIIDFVNVSKMF